MTSEITGRRRLWWEAEMRERLQAMFREISPQREAEGEGVREAPGENEAAEEITAQ